MIANRTEVADIFGVAKTTVDAWVSKGCPVIEKGARGTPSKYDTAAVYLWLKSGAVELDLTLERAKLAVEQTRQKKRENDIEERLVARVDILTEVLSSVCSQISAILSALPMNIKKQCPELPNRSIDYIKKEIAKACNLACEASLDAARKH